MITLNSKAQLTVDIIAKVAERKITIANAAKLLNKSSRTIERYLQRYREKALQFIVHGNTGSELYWRIYSGSINNVSEKY